MSASARANSGAAPIAKIAVSQVSYWFDLPYSYAIPPQMLPILRPGMRVVVPFGGGNRFCEGVVLSLGEDADKRCKPIEALLDEEPVVTAEQLSLALWMRERFFCTVMEAVRTMLPAGLWYDIECLYCRAEQADSAAPMPQKLSAAEQLILDAVDLHGGSCPMREVLNIFDKKDPRPALRSLEKRGLLVRRSRQSRRVGDKTLLQAELAVSPAEAETAAAQNRRAPQQASVLRLLCQIGSSSVANICFFTGASRDTLRSLEKKGLVHIWQQTAYRRPEMPTESAQPLPVLNEAQSAAFSSLAARLDAGAASASLLFGVTGSGKTTIYIHLIDHVLRQGRSAILMVPEIALTPQMLQTFSAYFGDGVAVLHSALSVGERYDEWRRIRAGLARVVIGTRSAVFAPVPKLGIIIMDEEQEETYKSDSAPRYHARDAAKYRCAKSGAMLLLGSATPDVCSMYAARTGKYNLECLPGRYNKMQLPRVMIADMRSELKAGNGGNISSLLCRELTDNIKKGEQSILFLNRRGAQKLVTCGECGYVFGCPNCSVSLTYHSVGDRLMCHYCGHTQPLPPLCPECGGRLKFTGAGTQAVVDELGQLFPNVPVLRMDTDSVAPVGSHRKLFERFASENIPIMVGTQMVAKGLNFANVTLVGVLSADQSLYCGDYRAGERTFSLVTQVVGRSGRFEKPGRAVIQTFTPDNQVIRQAAEQDYESFYSAEIALRRIAGAPPFADLYVITACGEDESAVLSCCEDIRYLLTKEFAGVPDAKILGPAPLPVARVNRTWRYRVTLACPENAKARRAVGAILVSCNKDKKYRGVSVYADFDPLD